MKYCTKCGAALSDTASFCPSCGTWQQPQSGNAAGQSYTVYNTYGGAPKDRTIALLLCCVGFLGFPAGLHRFYTGKFGTGILYLLTGGVFMIGTIIDTISIATGGFRDINGNFLR